MWKSLFPNYLTIVIQKLERSGITERKHKEGSTRRHVVRSVSINALLAVVVRRGMVLFAVRILDDDTVIAGFTRFAGNLLSRHVERGNLGQRPTALIL